MKHDQMPRTWEKDSIVNTRSNCTTNVCIIMDNILTWFHGNKIFYVWILENSTISFQMEIIGSSGLTNGYVTPYDILEFLTLIYHSGTPTRHDVCSKMWIYLLFLWLMIQNYFIYRYKEAPESLIRIHVPRERSKNNVILQPVKGQRHNHTTHSFNYLC